MYEADQARRRARLVAFLREVASPEELEGLLLRLPGLRAVVPLLPPARSMAPRHYAVSVLGVLEPRGLVDVAFFAALLREFDLEEDLVLGFMEQWIPGQGTNPQDDETEQVPQAEASAQEHADFIPPREDPWDTLVPATQDEELKHATEFWAAPPPLLDELGASVAPPPEPYPRYSAPDRGTPALRPKAFEPQVPVSQRSLVLPLVGLAVALGVGTLAGVLWWALPSDGAPPPPAPKTPIPGLVAPKATTQTLATELHEQPPADWVSYERVEVSRRRGRRQRTASSGLQDLTAALKASVRSCFPAYRADVGQLPSRSLTLSAAVMPGGGASRPILDAGYRGTSLDSCVAGRIAAARFDTKDSAQGTQTVSVALY